MTEPGEVLPDETSAEAVVTSRRQRSGISSADENESHSAPGEFVEVCAVEPSVSEDEAVDVASEEQIDPSALPGSIVMGVRDEGFVPARLAVSSIASYMAERTMSVR